MGGGKGKIYQEYIFFLRFLEKAKNTLKNVGGGKS